MNRLVNGIPSHADAGAMPALPVAAGVFETLLLRDGAAVFWPEHWARFAAGCTWHGFAPPISSASLRTAVEMLATGNGVRHGVARYAAWLAPDGEIVWCVDATPPRPHMAKPHFRLGAGPALPAPQPDRAHKHLRRTAWSTALAAARASGYDEVVLTDGAGSVVEGGVSNLFVVKNGVAKTPPLSAGPLPGIMRGALLALRAAGSVRVVEAPVTVRELEQADEVWITNSLIGLRPAAAFGTTIYPSVQPVLAQVRAAFLATYGWEP